MTIEFEECRLERRQRIFGTPGPAESTTILYAIEGSISVSFDTERYVLGPGDAVLVTSDRPHSIASTTTGIARFLRIRRNSRRKPRIKTSEGDATSET